MDEASPRPVKTEQSSSQLEDIKHKTGYLKSLLNKQFTHYTSQNKENKDKNAINTEGQLMMARSLQFKDRGANNELSIDKLRYSIEFASVNLTTKNQQANQICSQAQKPGAESSSAKERPQE